MENNVQTRLKAYLAKSKISQSEFGRSIGVSTAYVGSIRKGIDPDKLKAIASAYPDLNIDWLVYGEGEMIKTPEPEVMGQVPIVPFAVRGGALQGFSEGVSEMDCEKIISPVKGAELAMEVVGDSMAPGYPAGTRVLLKKVRAVIAWGEVYVIDSIDGPVLKRILPTDDESIWELRSDNPNYPPFKINTENVRGVWLVLLLMRQ